MAILTETALKAKFTSGKSPGAQDFEDLIDTLLDILSQWPGVLPAADASNLTDLSLPDPLPALSGENLTNVITAEFRDLASLTPAYASATSFTLNGDQTASGTNLTKRGRRVRLKVNGNYHYSSIESSSYAVGPNATTVVIRDAMPDVTLTEAAISIFNPFREGGAISPEMVGAYSALTPYPNDATPMQLIFPPITLQRGQEVIKRAQQISATITAPAGNPRIDLLCYDSVTGDYNIIAGTEAAAPIAPDPGEEDIVAGELSLVVGQTAITNEDIAPYETVRAEYAPIGVPLPYLGTTAPTGFLLLNGDSIGSAASAADHKSNDYDRLFEIIKNVSPNLGTEVFTNDDIVDLPDLRGRSLVGKDDMGGVAANIITAAWADVLGGIGGEEKHTQTISEMPSHNHSGTYWSGTAGTGINSTGSNQVISSSVLSQGGGSAFNVVHPSLSVNWIIRY